MLTMHQKILSKSLKLALFFTACFLDLMAADVTQSATNPLVVMDAAGNANSIWILSQGTSGVVQTSYLSKGGTWSTVQPLSSDWTTSGYPVLAGNANGDAVAVWLILGSRNYLGVAVYNSSTSSWGTAQAISTDSESVTGIFSAAIDDLGDIVIIWNSYPTGGGPGQLFVRTSSSSVSTGTWSTPVTLAPTP